jgi:hypothetical protein
VDDRSGGDSAASFRALAAPPRFPTYCAGLGIGAKRVADLGLHQYDMDLCESLLKDYGSRFVGEYDDLSRALWTAVLIKFISCFRSSEARGLLNEGKVYV